MKTSNTARRYLVYLCLHLTLLAICSYTTEAQSCPATKKDSIRTYPNTYYPAAQAHVNAGTSSILLDTAKFGSTPISAGDVVLIIQMQGAQINSTNTSSYGDATGTGSGYLNNGNLLAGNMEYVIASNSVPLTGGTLNTASALTMSYRSTPFSTDGQYTYQVIRVPTYYDVKLIGAITAPRWDGASGGVIVIYATDSIIMNSQTIDVSGLGFRGGGGIAFTGSGSGSSSDYISLAAANANGGKGEGIAGTPKYLNNNNAFLDVSGYEGYPNGSYGRGAPGNAGGGGTDGNPVNNNNENTGGGGGGNGGLGGLGGKAWSSGVSSGGRSGAIFSQVSPSRLVMGGGGGAGTTNNATGTPGNGFASSGAAGGGIIILMANAITGSGKVWANGAAGNTTVKNDGSGGGGAGGSILIFSKTGNLSSLSVNARGGAGGSNQASTVDPHGPGGGGGGGVIYTNATVLGTSSTVGGAAGTTDKGTNNYGATAGTTGTMLQSITQAQTPIFPLSCVVLASTTLEIAADQDNGTAYIHWNVSGETDIQQYIIEKSRDGIHFSIIGHIPYKYCSSGINAYEYPDNISEDRTGTLYYRVRQLAATGASQYSKIVSLNVGNNSLTFSVYPNPARSTATISFFSTFQRSVSLRLYDSKGSQVWQGQYITQTGQTNIQLDKLASLSNGIYILQWSDGLNHQQAKIMVNH